MRSQVLYRVDLEQADYDQLNADIEQFRNSLKDDYGLDVITMEDSSVGSVTDPRGIWDGARAVWSHVLMEVIDAYLDAAAVAAGADTFITADRSLRNALNRISRPEEDWEELADSLKQALTEAWRLDSFEACLGGQLSQRSQRSDRGAPSVALRWREPEVRIDTSMRKA